LLSSLLASAIGILFSYANLIICCLLLYFGQSRVPAACPGLAHVGHFGGVLQGSDGGWVCEHCLQMGGFVQVSSGCPNVQHLRHSAGLGMNCLTGKISWAMMTSLGSCEVLKKSVTVFSGVVLPSSAGAVNRCTFVTPCSVSRNRMSSS